MNLLHDMELEISTGKNRKDMNWKSSVLSWSTLVTRLSKTHRTAETHKEYMSSKPDRQAEIKDVGGFVGGTLSGGRRKNDTVINRSLICLDVDFGNMDLWETYKVLYGHAAVVYSTHKHAPASNRLRIVIPLSEAVSRELYEPIARKIAGDLGINAFDDTTFEAARLMFWPSTAQDGEYIFDYVDGDFLDGEAVLATYKDWTDVSSWVRSDRVQSLIKREMVKQGDPLAKTGLIGAFCRSYDVHEVIEKFLPGVYVKCDVPNRYTFIGGSTAAGAVVYDDKFLYSHHGTDPCSMRLCNVFDLVRIQLFGLLDAEDTDKETPQNKLPSFTKMNDLCLNDVKTRTLAAHEHIQEAKNDFAGYDVSNIEENDDTGWKKQLEISYKGGIAPSIDNVFIILNNDPLIKKKLATNDFDKRQYQLGLMPWHDTAKMKDGPKELTDADFIGLVHYMATTYRVKGKEPISDGMTLCLTNNTFHPIKDYLNGCIWDDKPRLDTLLIDYLGAEDNEINRVFTRKALVAAVARVFEPGCKYDYALTLIGKQGGGKSTLLHKLGCAWFSDSLSGMKTKDDLEQLQGAWIIELGELSQLRRTDLDQIKQFITKQVDRFRVSYGKRTADYPRSCVFFGTTNNRDFLKDQTGNRRWWPVDTHIQTPAKSVFKDLTQPVIDQIWAEAVSLYHAGETQYLTPEQEALAFEVQEDHMEVNEKTGSVTRFLEMELPETWEDLDLAERVAFIHNKDHRKAILAEGVKTFKRDKVCVAEIWCELMGGFLKDLTPLVAREYHDMLRKVENFEEHVGGQGRRRFKLYGAQKCYDRLQTVTM